MTDIDDEKESPSYLIQSTRKQSVFFATAAKFRREDCIDAVFLSFTSFAKKHCRGPKFSLGLFFSFWHRIPLIDQKAFLHPPPFKKNDGPK